MMVLIAIWERMERSLPSICSIVSETRDSSASILSVSPIFLLWARCSMRRARVRFALSRRMFRSRTSSVTSEATIERSTTSPSVAICSIVLSNFGAGTRTVIEVESLGCSYPPILSARDWTARVDCSIETTTTLRSAV